MFAVSDVDVTGVSGGMGAGPLRPIRALINQQMEWKKKVVGCVTKQCCIEIRKLFWG